MRYTVEEQRQLKELMFKLFSKVETYPKNSMTASLSQTEEELQVNMLILGDNQHIATLKNDKSREITVATDIYTETINNGSGRDLIIRLGFHNSTGDAQFETVIYGDEPQRQQVFVHVLRQVNKITVWVSSLEYEVIRVINVTFDSSYFEEVFKELDQMRRGG
jgi:hypothetical protein